MDKFSITRRIEIDAAHRVPLHGSGCRALHGHRYVIEATCTGTLYQGTEQDGMVLDFGFLKQEMMAIIHRTCDHGLILQRTDPLIEVLSSRVYREISMLQRIQTAPTKPFFYSDILDWERGLKFYILSDAPTAENLARHWYLRLAPRVKEISNGNAALANVRVFETPNCCAIYPLNEEVT